MAASTGRTTRALRRLTVAALLACTLVLATAGTAVAAAVWRLDAAANTAVAPGANTTYLLSIENVGDLLAFGAIELRVELPSTLRGVSVFNRDGNWSCPAIAGSSSFTCQFTGLFINTGAAGFQRVTLDVRADGAAAGITLARFELSGGGANNTARALVPVRVESDAPRFGIEAFDGAVNADAAGNPYTQAGGHPYSASTDLDFNTSSTSALDPPGNHDWPTEAPRDLFVDLPPGLVGDPTGIEQCTLPQLATGVDCPTASQVGTVAPRFNNGSFFRRIPVFNMVPPPDAPARFGFIVLGTVVVLDATLRSGSDYGLTVRARQLSEGLAITGSSLTFWGTPADSSHDAERGCTGQQPPSLGGPSCSSQATPEPFLRNPTACTAPGVGLPTTIYAASWQNPGRLDANGRPDLSDPAWASSTFFSHLPPGYPLPSGMGWGALQGPTGCENVPFDPTLTVRPEPSARANVPAGFTFDLTLPQTSDKDVIGTSDLKKAVVTLPVGMRVWPPSAYGLAGCSPAEIGLNSIADPSCSERSRVGSLRIETPLLDEPLHGSIYLATPNNNKFNSLLSLYLVARGPGVIVKLPGRIDANSVTGRLTATFDDQPQLPFDNLHLEFTGGPRAPLVTPPQCGTYTTRAEMTGWSGAVAISESTFTISRKADGSACGPLAFAPVFKAGVDNAAAGRSSSFQLSVRRGAGDREIESLSVDLPHGLLARIADATLCGTAQAAAGTCGADSRVGSVTVGAGPGALPFYITDGRAHITGPYKGAPFGLSIVVHAKAGPFDLGMVVVRSALFVDKHTADVRVVADPLPSILQGIPLQVSDIRVAIDKPGFMVNPTNCSVQQVRGSIKPFGAGAVPVSSRFQVGGCRSLPLRPRMDLRVAGRPRFTRRGASTPFTATLRQTPGQSNLKSVKVNLPMTINARLDVVNRACTRAAYEAGNCEQARAGSAVAITPLLRDPLRGSAYFVRNGRALPDLFVRLRGQVEFDLIGRISIPGGKRLATTFDAIPDVPVSMFRLSLVAGRQGPVGNAANLCTKRSRRAAAQLTFVGQNGVSITREQRLKVAGCRGARRAARRGARRGRR